MKPEIRARQGGAVVGEVSQSMQGIEDSARRISQIESAGGKPRIQPQPAFDVGGTVAEPL
jgi:hypothetical protein